MPAQGEKRAEPAARCEGLRGWAGACGLRERGKREGEKEKEEKKRTKSREEH